MEILSKRRKLLNFACNSSSNLEFLIRKIEELEIICWEVLTALFS